LDEYVPERGEFGATSDPIPNAEITSVWGSIVGSTRRQSDVLRAQTGRAIRSPARGVVRTVEEVAASSSTQVLTAVEVETPRGLVLRLSAFIPLPSVIPGSTIEAGQILGRVSSEIIEFSVTKLPVGGFGKRSVRPLYFFTTVENRDGRK
jgi:hypothetical protein